MTRPRSSARLAAALLFFVACSDGAGVHAPNAAPAAHLEAPTCVLAGEDVVFDASGSLDGDGHVVEYRFVFGDGTAEVRSLSPRARHAFAGPGAYEIALTVVDNEGQRGRTTALVRILARAECRTDTDCADGARCLGDVCQPPADGGACVSVPAACPSGITPCGTVMNNCDALTVCWSDGCCRPPV